MAKPSWGNTRCNSYFGNGRCVMFDNRDGGRLMQTALSEPSITLSGTLGSNQLYHLDTLKSMSCKHAFLATHTPMLKLEMLHQALGHINYQTLISMIQKGTIHSANLTQAELSTFPPPCDSCLKGKSTWVSFPASESKHTKTVLGLVHSNLWGPAPVKTLNSSCYLMTLSGFGFTS